jgi:transketolase
VPLAAAPGRLTVLRTGRQGTVLAVSAALEDIPHRILGLGVGRAELRRYGTAAEHQAAHGLDARSPRESITRFLGG